MSSVAAANPNPPLSDLPTLDLRQSPQRPVTRIRNMDKIGDFLSPAEAEFAYEGAEKENQTPETPGLFLPLAPGKVDSPLDVIDEETHPASPIVSPLESTFARYPSPIARDHQRPAETSSAGPPPAVKHVKDICPIFVELRTNVIVKDEYRLVTDLSSLLSRLYLCSQDGISVTVEHSACLMLAASFDPAYLLDLTTTPQQLDHDLNASNTVEVQRLMHRILRVPNHRGMLRFRAILEENVGMTGSTVARLNHRTPQQMHQARRAESRTDHDEDGFGPTNGANPLAPNPTSANNVLRQQINSMADPERDASLVSPVSALGSPEKSPDLNDADVHDHRRNQSDMALNFHRPRPVSTYSSRFREDNVDWRPMMPTPSSSDDRQRSNNFFPPVSRTTSAQETDLNSPDSPDSSMPPPPPIPQNRSDVGKDKISRRKSLFAVFRK